MKADKSNCEKPAHKSLMETPLSRRGLFAALARGRAGIVGRQ